MITKSPSGALSPYYYKGGYFHGIHYGGYLDDMTEFLDMVDKEEAFILKSPEKKRILMDLYETNLTADENALEKFVKHIEHLEDKIIKLGISAEKNVLKKIKKAIEKNSKITKGRIYYCPDMETTKTWIVSDNYK